MHIYDVVSDVVWHKHVHLKVSICAWRLLCNWWPTKDNLMRCDIISIDSQLCVSGCGDNESADHLLIHCPTFGSLWQHVKTRGVQNQTNPIENHKPNLFKLKPRKITFGSDVFGPFFDSNRAI